MRIRRGNKKAPDAKSGAKVYEECTGAREFRPDYPRSLDFLPSGLYRRHRNHTGSILCEALNALRVGVAGFNRR